MVNIEARYLSPKDDIRVGSNEIDKLCNASRFSVKSYKVRV